MAYLWWSTRPLGESSRNRRNNLQYQRSSKYELLHVLSFSLNQFLELPNVHLATEKISVCLLHCTC